MVGGDCSGWSIMGRRVSFGWDVGAGDMSIEDSSLNKLSEKYRKFLRFK